MGVAHNARSVAFDALMRVELDKAYLDRVLGPALARTNLAQEDRALATELAFGVVRRRSYLDQAIGRYLDRPLDAVDLPVLTALRLGAYQLLVLDRIPPHAAVSETVELVKLRHKSAQGFVNAVLRKLSRHPRPVLTETAADLALAASCPAWIVEALSEALASPGLDPALEWRDGRPAASLAELCAALARPASPTLRVLSRRLGRDVLLERLLGQGIEAAATPASPHGVVVRRVGEVGELDGFGRDFIAQDEAAQWVAELARGETGAALDACAAPGGKTVALWDLGLGPLTALEANERRTRALLKTIEAAGLEVEVVNGSATAPPWPERRFNVVFVDAPCLGTGTLRRHPEMRWRLQRDDIGRLVSVQAEILRGTAGLVAPGGALIYAVCSVLPEEGPRQIERFLAEHPELRLERWLWTLPWMHEMDGFFAAKLRRAT